MGNLQRMMYQTYEVQLLQQISYLEGDFNRTNELIATVKKFKSSFVLTEDDWSSEVSEDSIKNRQNKKRKRQRIKKINELLHE